MSVGKEKIFLFGASGHAKVVIDVIEKQGCYDISCIVDDDERLNGSMLYNYPVIGGKKALLQKDDALAKGIVAIGNNRIRYTISQWLEEHQYGLISAIHPSAQIGRDVEIGQGSVCMANTVINPSTRIGKYVIINTGATVDHDCIVGDAVHVAPGAVLCGTVRIGERSFVGAGSTIIQNLTVGGNVMVGAGTTVYKDIPGQSSVVGAR